MKFLPMFRRVPLQLIALVIVFTFCQVIGTMCALPDLSEAEGTAILVENSMACPMDGTIMCPPSLTASPERQIKNSLVVDLDYALIPDNHTEAPASLPVQASWFSSDAYSIVPISVSSSSVLRI